MGKGGVFDFPVSLDAAKSFGVGLYEAIRHSEGLGLILGASHQHRALLMNELSIRQSSLQREGVAARLGLDVNSGQAVPDVRIGGREESNLMSQPGAVEAGDRTRNLGPEQAR